MAIPVPSPQWLSLALILLAASQVEGRPQLKGDNEGGAFLSVSLVAGVAGLVGITLVVMVCAGNKKVNPNVNRKGPPEWTRSLVLKPEMNVGFGDCSEGIHTPTPYHVIRERLGQSMTDAARWTCPIQDGKHVFEVYWPSKKNRGVSSCIGMGSKDVNLTKQGRCSLVGEHSQSWGLDMPKQRSIHFNKMQQRLYRGIPDRFFVYIDMDSGKIGFGDNVVIKGNETEFFGYICHGIPKNKEMFFMISMCGPNENVHVFYRGSAAPAGGYNLVDTPSPLQFSADGSGKQQVVAPAAPPSYMAAVNQTQAGAPIPEPAPAAGPYHTEASGNLQF